MDTTAKLTRWENELYQLIIVFLSGLVKNLKLSFFYVCSFKMLYIPSLKYAIIPQGTNGFIAGISYAKCIVTKYPE